MTTPDVRPEIVNLLTDLTLDKTTNKFVHHNGQPFTTDEINLVGQASRRELDAARELILLQIEFHQSQATTMTRFTQLVEPYFAQLAPGTTLDQAMAAMPPAERAEAQRLMDQVAPDGTFVIHGALEDRR